MTQENKNNNKVVKKGLTKKTSQKKFFNKNFKAILLLSSLILLFVIYVFIFSPAFNKYQEFSLTTIEEHKKELEDSKKVLNEINKLNTIYTEISQQLKDKIINILPSDSEIANIYYNLEQMATQVGYELVSVDINEIKENKSTRRVVADPLVLEQAEDKLKKIEILITLEGRGYLKVKDFLNLLEKNLRLVDIQTIEYAAEDTQLNIKMMVYYYDNQPDK